VAEEDTRSREEEVDKRMGGNKPSQKPQLPQDSTGPSLSGSESGQNQGMNPQQQVNQGMNPQQQVNQGGLGEFTGFPQMWGNPNFQQFGWQPPFPMQFMPQMMQGN
jgi:hypothetical protein